MRGQWPDLICFWFKLGACVCAHVFHDPAQSGICIISIISTLRNNAQHATREARTPDLEVTALRSNQLSYGSRCSFGCTLSSMCLICSVLLSSVLFCFVLCCCVGSLAFSHRGRAHKRKGPEVLERCRSFACFPCILCIYFRFNMVFKHTSSVCNICNSE